MATPTQARVGFPRTQEDWALAYARLMTLFALQGVILMALYLTRGFDTPPDAMPLGLQLDPLHSLIHLLTGLIGAAIGFWRPAAALPFIRAFGLAYLGLAVLGTFTSFHLGMQLALPENGLHWVLGLAAAAIGFGPNLLFVRRIQT